MIDNIKRFLYHTNMENKTFNNETEIIEYFSSEQFIPADVGNYSFHFEKWPDLVIKDPYKNMIIGYNFIQSLTAFQEELYHSYALLKYNNPTKKLTDAEKQSLQIQVKIKEGCTEYIISGAKIITELLKNMTGTQITICIILLGLLYFGNRAFSSLLDYKKDKNNLNEESQKYNAAIEALSKSNAVANEVYIRSIEAQKEIIKPLINNPSVQFGNTIFSSEDMSEILKRSRSQFEQTRLDDFYIIEKIEQLETEGFKCTLTNKNNSFTALLPSSLFNNEKLPIIQDSLFNRKVIYCVINAKVNSNKLKDAELLDVDYKEINYNKPNLINIEEEKEI